MKIGLISDTHIPEAGESLPHRVREVFENVDLILHAGDLHVLDVLDWLEQIAPVKAVRGNGDDGVYGRTPVPNDPRLLPVQTLTIEGVRIGLAHVVPLPEDTPWHTLEQTMDRLFGGPVDVIVFGDSHVDYVGEHNGVLLVNPGSPTLPFNLEGFLGTVGILEVNNGRARSEIVPLGEWPIRR